MPVIRRWFTDPSNQTLAWQSEALAWAMVAGLVWVAWPVWWPIWLGAQIAWTLIFGGE